jgi:hypothetical protein
VNTYRTAKILTTGYMLLATALSFTHIAGLFQMLGSTWQAWLAPILIDGMWLLGILGQSTKFTPATRKAGRKLIIVAGLVSLTANVIAGANPGDRTIGAMVLIGFAAGEWYSRKLRPTTKRGPVKARKPASRKPAAARTRKPAAA